MNRTFLLAPLLLGLFAAPLPGLGQGATAPYLLTNGLTVILRPIAGTTNVAVALLYSLGGDHDPAGQSGRAHLLEHVYCTAAAGSTPARDFGQIPERYPAGFNHQTGADYTVFAGVVGSKELPGELQDAALRMRELRIEEGDLAREIPRVVAELENMYGGIPTLAGINHLRQHLHPIPGEGRHGGQPAHVTAITRAGLEAFWRDHYKPTNAVLVVVGGFQPTETKALIAEHFGSIPSGRPPPPTTARLPAATGQSHRVTVKPAQPNAIGLVCMGVAPPTPGSTEYPAFLLAVSRLWTLSQADMKPGEPQPVYFPVLDDARTMAMQAAWKEGTDPKASLTRLEERLQEALSPPLRSQEKQQALHAMSFLGTVQVADALWARNLYGLAFSLGRRHQLKLDGEALHDAILKVTEADLERLGETTFAPGKRISVIVDLER